MPKVKTFMYHEEHPNGKQFDLDADDQAELEGDGWVDTPAKLKGGDLYEEADDEDHEELQSEAPHANNQTRPAGLPLGASSSTVVSVSDDDIDNKPKPARVRKPKTADGKAKAEPRAKRAKGKEETELPPAPADANADATSETEANAEANANGTAPAVAPLKAD